jgi:hypothetical protein
MKGQQNTANSGFSNFIKNALTTDTLLIINYKKKIQAVVINKN